MTENLPCCLEMNDKLTDVSRHPLRVESDLKFFLKEVNENKKVLQTMECSGPRIATG